MKLNFTKPIIILGAFFFLSPITKSVAQDFVNIFRASEEDVTQYMDSYIEPAMFSFANGMAGGWYNTAKTHKPLGFDLTFTVNVANIPSSERLFLFNPNDYGNLRLAGDLTSSQTADLPTLVGGDTNERLELYGQYTAPDGSTYEYTSGETFQAPDGIDVSDLPLAGVPAPTLQLGIGLIKNTDLKIRYGRAKDMELDDNTNNKYGVDIFGIAVMHDFKQWIPGIKHLPLDMALLVGYSRFKTTIDFDENEPGVFSAEGTASLTANNTTIQALVSKKLSILTLYGGIGYNIVSSGIKVDGEIVNYDLTDVITGEPYTVEDPVDFTYDGGSTFRGTAGMRLKLAFITLHADYTFQKYNMLSAGLGFTFR
ncbi:MAG: DUF6588 family protein [Reichenbachiella sp.]|uniref:DUF6588 family protein n=1 Tax=Reichenbachiella sp. TaxID=2184521 RepID=UPI003298AB4B